MKKLVFRRASKTIPKESSLKGVEEGKGDQVKLLDDEIKSQLPKGISELRALIDSSGLSHTNVIEREELETLAAEAIKILAVAEDDELNELYVDTEDVSTEGSEWSNITSNSTSSRGSRVSIRLKKKMASKIGESKVGRSTLLRLVGETGIDIVQTLKEAVTEFENKEKAKSLKKSTIKFALKFGVLLQHKNLTRENTEDLRIQSQLLVERIRQECESKAQGDRDISNIVNNAERLRLHMVELLSPFIQEKNIEKLSELVAYYGNAKFLDFLLNSAQGEPYSSRLLNSINSILLRLDSVLEAINKQKERVSYIEQMLQLDAEHCIYGRFPEVSELFKKFLQIQENAGANGLNGINALKFLTAVKEFKQISNKRLLKPRATMILAKHIEKEASHPVFQQNTEQLETLRKSVQNHLKDPKSNMFASIALEVEKLLEDEFRERFVHYSAFVEHRKSAVTEKSQIQKSLALLGAIDEVEIEPAPTLGTK